MKTASFIKQLFQMFKCEYIEKPFYRNLDRSLRAVCYGLEEHQLKSRCNAMNSCMLLLSINGTMDPAWNKGK